MEITYNGTGTHAYTTTDAAELGWRTWQYPIFNTISAETDIPSYTDHVVNAKDKEIKELKKEIDKLKSETMSLKDMLSSVKSKKAFEEFINEL